MEYPAVDWSGSATAGDWLVASMPTFAETVTSLVPAGFAGYARLPHRDPDGDTETVGTLPRSQLEALAAAVEPYAASPIWFAIWEGFGWFTGAVAHMVAADGPDDDRAAMIARLRARDVAFRATLPAARLRLPNRDYLLYRGTVADATTVFPGRQSANLWWPADRSWCVATEIDLRATYIAGSAAVIDAVLPVGAARVAPTDPIGLRAGD